MGRHYSEFTYIFFASTEGVLNRGGVYNERPVIQTPEMKTPD